jgi:hypothetical protein
MKATVTWDGHSWVGILDEGGITRSDRLELLLERLPELAQLMTGQTVPASEIQLQMAWTRPINDDDEPAAGA